MDKRTKEHRKYKDVKPPKLLFMEFNDHDEREVVSEVQVKDPLKAYNQSVMYNYIKTEHSYQYLELEDSKIRIDYLTKRLNNQSHKMILSQQKIRRLQKVINSLYATISEIKTELQNCRSLNICKGGFSDLIKGNHKTTKRIKSKTLL
uniref:Uncharacterized protein n=1 Tax=Photinus pyralis TaxID=7054 RepID=A0A1Y1MYR0_PHOPY